jgi:hypothetical protein
MKMAEYILSILRSRPMVVMSWGSQKFKALENDKGLSFTVNGFRYQGIVKVEYDHGSDTFTVIVGNEVQEDVHLGEVVDVIDVLVETGDMGQDDYEECVTDWLKTAMI